MVIASLVVLVYVDKMLMLMCLMPIAHSFSKAINGGRCRVGGNRHGLLGGGPERMSQCPKPYSKDACDDVVVGRPQSLGGATLVHVAADFGCPYGFVNCLSAGPAV